MVRDKVTLPLLLMVCAKLEKPLLESDEGGEAMQWPQSSVAAQRKP